MPSDTTPAGAWLLAGVAVLGVVVLLLIVAQVRIARIERRLRAVTDRLGMQEPGALPSDPLGIYSSAQTVIAGPPSPAPTPMPAPAAPAGATDGLDVLLAQGRKIQAIKVYRERTGVGLREAKDAVEELARRRGL